MSEKQIFCRICLFFLTYHPNNYAGVVKDVYGYKNVLFRHYQKAKLKHASAIVVRDSLRNEVSKQQMTAEELKEKQEQQV